MSTDYMKTWESMNDLEQVTSKIVSAREILNAAQESLEKRNFERTETLMAAAQEFLAYYLQEFDEKFQVAWKETVVASKDDGFYWDTDSADYDKSPWVDCFDAFEASTKKKWTLPIEMISNGDLDKPDYFITLPDDLLEQVGWTEGTELNWIDNGDGSYTLTKA